MHRFLRRSRASVTQRELGRRWVQDRSLALRDPPRATDEGLGPVACFFQGFAGLAFAAGEDEPMGFGVEDQSNTASAAQV